MANQIEIETGISQQTQDLRLDVTEITGALPATFTVEQLGPVALQAYPDASDVDVATNLRVGGINYPATLERDAPDGNQLLLDAIKQAISVETEKSKQARLDLTENVVPRLIRNRTIGGIVMGASVVLAAEAWVRASKNIDAVEGMPSGQAFYLFAVSATALLATIIEMGHVTKDLFDRSKINGPLDEIVGASQRMRHLKLLREAIKKVPVSEDV